jgi:peptidoglycan/LPS O-acetylase OafA/YrhL
LTANPIAAPDQVEIRPTYRPDIDGLRAVAIIAVVLYHAGANLLPGGFIGVDVFFVISGFLISSLIFKELDQGDFRFGDFYVRRVRRIFPALILMMTAVWVLACFTFTSDEFVQLGRYILSGGAFISNLMQWRYAGYFDTDAALKPLQHLWSLGIEEQFYIVWPVTVVLLWKRRFPLWVLAAMALSFAFNILRTPHHATGAFFLPFGRAWELLLGAILAWSDRYRALVNRDRRIALPLLSDAIALQDIAALLGVSLLAAGLWAIGPDSAFPGWWVLLPTLAAFLLIWAGERAWINAKLLANPVMVFVGLISYPLYIWHWPLLSLLRILGNGAPSIGARAATVALSVLLATATYLLVERPLRRARWRRGPVMAALCSAAATLCLLGYLSNAHLIESPRMAADAAAEAAARRAFDHISDCSGFLDRKAAIFSGCRIWGDPALKKNWVIWGDSHAHAWVTVAATLAKERGARLVEFFIVACPPLIEVRRVAPHSHLGEACNDMAIADETMRTIQRVKPQLSIMAARWTLYVYGFHNGGTNTEGPLAENTFLTMEPQGDATAQTSALALKAKIPQTIRELAALGQVMVIETVPTLHSTIAIGLARDPKGYEPSLAEYRAFEAMPNQLIDQAASDIPNVTVLDPAVTLCDARKCHAVLNGVRIYGGDNTHLSDAGALAFLPQMRKLVK